ncbi:MAG: alpha/beta hydrolase fold domain-containing protein [Isosphaeraceae bacterium]
MRKIWFIVHALGWLSVVGLVAWLWFRDPLLTSTTAGREDQTILRDRAYRMIPSGAVKLDVYLPPNRTVQAGSSGLLPGVLAIHGGSWIGGSKSEYGPQLARLTRHGYVVFAADYQLARPGKPSWPGALEDLREAIRWIRRHADKFLVDPNRLVVFGSGSGAHLALLLGTFPPDHEPGGISSRAQAVVSMYGPADLADLVTVRHLSNDPARQLLGQDPPHWLARARAASPLEHVSRDDSPTLLVHGTDDRWVPLEQSQRMAESLSQAGVLNRLIVVPGARHGFELPVKFPETRDLLPEVLAFLDSVWQVHLRDHVNPSHSL